MSANNAGSKQNDAYVYHGQKGDNIPEGVICIRVHPSVRVIRGRAFLGHKLLMSVELHNGIEAIKEEAFLRCTSLQEILIPPAIRAIKKGAFYDCSGLMTAVLNSTMGWRKLGRRHFTNARLSSASRYPPLSGQSRVGHSLIARG
jgi:hypothetical protein